MFPLWNVFCFGNVFIVNKPLILLLYVHAYQLLNAVAASSACQQLVSAQLSLHKVCVCVFVYVF